MKHEILVDQSKITVWLMEYAPDIIELGDDAALEAVRSLRSCLSIGEIKEADSKPQNKEESDVNKMEERPVR